MDFTFDPNKDHENLKRHGIDFEQAQEMWNGTHVIIPAKNVSGENRYAILGKVGGKVCMGIFTMRDDGIRLISACRETDFEKKSFSLIFPDSSFVFNFSTS